MKIVELRPAHTWTCEECGADNFELGVVVELSMEEKKEMQEEDLPTEAGFWMTGPKEVKCKVCGEEFETEEYGEVF